MPAGPGGRAPSWAALAAFLIAAPLEAATASDSPRTDSPTNVAPATAPVIEASPIRALAAFATAPSLIRLAAGYTIDPAGIEPVLPPELRAPVGPAGGRRAVLVHYGDADPEPTRAAIEADGGLIVAYVPDHTFLVRMPAERGLASLSRSAKTFEFQPAYKIDERLASGAATESIVLTVLLFPDGALSEVSDVARALGAEVLASADGVNRLLRVRAPATAVAALAGEPDVQWIEPYIPPRAVNDRVQGIVQTGQVDNRRLWDLGIRGEGQVLMTSDSGINTAHQQFRDPARPITDFGDYPTHRKLIAYRRGSSDPMIVFGDHGNFHGTHTAGTAVGNDEPTGGTSLADGMAKNAKLFFIDVSGPLLGNSMVAPIDLNNLFGPAYAGNAGGAARISSNSWGSSLGGEYTSDAFEVDQFAWLHPDFLMVFACGNDQFYRTVNSPGSAKNCITVGATGNGGSMNNTVAFTSRGPAKDGRFKPTLVAPGESVQSAYTNGADYQVLSGTSMSTPAVAGCVALMRQYLMEGWYPTGARVQANGFTPSAALLKAMAVNSAVNTIVNFSAPDSSIGWGRIDADSVLYFAGDTRRLALVDQRAGLAHGQSIEYRVNVADATQPLEVTLCWTDYPATPVSARALVNDLDLTVTNGAASYRGNVYAGGLSIPGGSGDRLNVEENVRIAVPAAGVWTIRVDGVNVPHGLQGFGLAVTGGLSATSGTLALDRASYGSAGTVQVRLVDTDAGPSAGVRIASTSEPAGELVTVTGPNGALLGSIEVSPAAGVSGDHVLRVSSGDRITATYQDLSPVVTLTAFADVNFAPPRITNVHAVNAGAGTVLVTWDTDANSTSGVLYGTTPALGSTRFNPDMAFRHASSIPGLTPGQTYYFDIEVWDASGNVARDDNGGAHHRFTVEPRADLLLVYDGNAFERDTRYAAALSALGWSYDVWQGALSDKPRLGDATVGLRSYRAVWWQNGLEHYPGFSDAARDSLTQYLEGGGRLAVVGHDISWANQDATGSAYYSADRAAWMRNTLHTNFLDDPQQWFGVRGIPGSPVSGDYLNYIAYEGHRLGGSGDEVSIEPGAGSGDYDWTSGDPTPDHCGFLWQSNGPLGVPGTAVWGGLPTRLATMYFEWSGIDPQSDVSVTRDQILDNTLVWLTGRRRPGVTLQAPNGGALLTDSTSIAWTEATFGGLVVAERTLEYSLDDGQSWSVITTNPGASPYTWDLRGVPNAIQARVRVRITDSGTPSLTSRDGSDASFAIQRPGGDVRGPVVVAGSLRSNPNPIDTRYPATLYAGITDTRTGGVIVTQAEWSIGAAAAPAGAGNAMFVLAPGAVVNALGTLTTGSFTAGPTTLWVRGRDATGNWGPASGLPLVVNATAVAGVDARPREFALGPVVPNPMFGAAAVSYALPEAADITLDVYDVTGRRVRDLARGHAAPGVHVATWDRRADDGRLVEAGVYYYRLAVAGRTFVRRVAVLR